MANKLQNIYCQVKLVVVKKKNMKNLKKKKVDRPDR